MNQVFLDKDCAIRSIRVFFESDFHILQRAKAVLHIIRHTAPDVKSDVATEAVNICLERLQEFSEGARSLEGLHSLSLALSISEVVS